MKSFTINYSMGIVSQSIVPHEGYWVRITIDCFMAGVRASLRMSDVTSFTINCSIGIVKDVTSTTID